MLKLLKAIILLLVIQVASYLIIGQDKIDLKILSELKFHVNEINNLGIYTDRKLNKKQKEKIVEVLIPKFGLIEFAKDIEDYSDNYRVNPNKYGLSYKVKFEPFFLASSKENSGTLYYGESWETKFVWLFFDWIIISKKCTGQS